MPRIDLTGKKINMLKVIDFSHSDKFAYWNCECNCGNKTIVRSDKLTSGHTKSCGCLTEENVIQNIFKNNTVKVDGKLQRKKRISLEAKDAYNYSYNKPIADKPFTPIITVYIDNDISQLPAPIAKLSERMRVAKDAYNYSYNKPIVGRKLNILI